VQVDETRLPTRCLASFEMFRRALVCKDQEAWEVIYKLYHRLIAYWVDGACEQMEEKINDAFFKLNAEINAATFDQKFSNFAMLMGYLKRIALNIRCDSFRSAKERNERRSASLDQIGEVIADSRRPSISEAVENQDFYQVVRKRMKDEKERLVLDLTLLGYSPRMIAQENAERFHDAGEVNVIKERILFRLRNDPRLSWD
jgi:DNA-directed RNA polymerase specialized sigma24 family protein